MCRPCILDLIVYKVYLHKPNIAISDNIYHDAQDLSKLNNLSGNKMGGTLSEIDNIINIFE